MRDHMTALWNVPTSSSSRVAPLLAVLRINSTGWEASQKRGAYTIHQPTIPFPTSHLIILIDPARSSSASSQPHKLASSTPRSVFGQVPSWPPSSMIHEVRTPCRSPMSNSSLLPPLCSTYPSVWGHPPPHLSTSRARIVIASAHSLIRPFFFSLVEGCVRAWAWAWGRFHRPS